MGACLCCNKNPFPEEVPLEGRVNENENKREKEKEKEKRKGKEEEKSQSHQSAFKYHLLIKDTKNNNAKNESAANSVRSNLIEAVNNNNNNENSNYNHNHNHNNNNNNSMNKRNYNNNNNNSGDKDRNNNNKSLLLDNSASREVNEPNRKSLGNLEKKKSTDTAIQPTEVDENVDWTDESNVRPHAERDHDSSEESSMRSYTNPDHQKEDHARRMKIHKRQETHTTTTTTTVITHKEKEEKTEVIRERSDKDSDTKDIQISIMAITMDDEPIKPNSETLINVRKEEDISLSLSSSSLLQQKVLPILYHQSQPPQQQQNYELEKKDDPNDQQQQQQQKPHPYLGKEQIWETSDTDTWNRVFLRCLEKMKHRQHIQYQARFKQFMQNENQIKQRQNIENNPENYYLMEMNQKQNLAEHRRQLFLEQRRAKAMIWTKNMLKRLEERKAIQQKKELNKAKKTSKEASAYTTEETIDESEKEKLLPDTTVQSITTVVANDENNRLSDLNATVQTYKRSDMTTTLKDQSKKSYSEEEEDNDDIKEIQESNSKQIQHEKPNYDSNITESVHLLDETSSDTSSSEEEINGLELNRAFKKRRKANKKLGRAFLTCEEHEHGEARAEKIKKQRESLKGLYDFYMQQYLEKRKKEQEAARKRNQTLTNIKFPPKPKGEFSSHCTQTLKIIGRFICAGSRFTGAASFENQTTEVPLEIDITSDRNELGEFTGKRTPFDNILGACEGKGRLWCDMVWNEKKKAYQEGVCFRWMDEQQGVMTVLEFNTVCDHMDIRHAFYEGVIMRYPAFTNPKEAELEKVTQYGIFDFLCTSKKTNYKESLEYGTFGHEWLYAEEESIDQSTEEPRFVQRMFDYAETIEEARTKDKRESLKLPEGEDWASHLFGKPYSVYGSRNSNSSSVYPANLDLQAFDPNLPRRCLALRSQGDNVPN